MVPSKSDRKPSASTFVQPRFKITPASFYGSFFLWKFETTAIKNSYSVSQIQGAWVRVVYYRRRSSKKRAVSDPKIRREEFTLHHLLWCRQVEVETAATIPRGGGRFGPGLRRRPLRVAFLVTVDQHVTSQSLSAGKAHRAETAAVEMLGRLCLAFPRGDVPHGPGVPRSVSSQAVGRVEHLITAGALEHLDRGGRRQIVAGVAVGLLSRKQDEAVSCL